MQELKVELNLGKMLVRNATHYPHKLAVVVGDTRLTYQEFNRRVNKTAHALQKLGLQKGDRLVMLLSNSVEMLELYWATAKIGGVIVPLNPMVKGTDMVRLINDCGATLLVTADNYHSDVAAIRSELSNIPLTGFICVPASNGMLAGYLNYTQITETAPDTEPEIAVSEDDPYNIMYSSGTTGLPKGIVHTHRTRIMYAFLWGMEYGVVFDSVVMCAGSLVFNGSLAFMFPAICAGATFVVLPKFNLDLVMETIQRERVTHTVMVPTQIFSLLDSPNFSGFNLSSLKTLLTLGAPMPVERKKEINKKLPGVLYELYGLTEGFLTTIRPQDVLKKIDSVGPPMIFNEFKIVDEDMRELGAGEVGEIIGRGPTLMTGYYNNPIETERSTQDGGWIKTGDLGRKDEEGFIYLVDRKKDLIISGGVNIYPRDIEEVIARHKSVAEAAVFGVPHAKWGETPYAQVILKQGCFETEEGLLNWINSNVSARYQRLHGLKIVESFPRNAAGKILKRQMRQTFLE